MGNFKIWIILFKYIREICNFLLLKYIRCCTGYFLMLWKIFCQLNTSSIYDVRNRELFYTRPVKSVNKGTESLSFLVPKIYELIPESFKDLLLAFKLAIKQWKPKDCPCKLVTVEQTFQKLALCNVNVWVVVFTHYRWTYLKYFVQVIFFVSVSF